MKRFVILALAAFSLISASSPKSLVVLDEQTIILDRAIDAESTAAILQKVLASDRTHETIYIDSPGGSVMSGVHLIQTLKDTGKHFTCVVHYAGSMAFVLVQSLCHTRLIRQNGVLMQHQATYGIEPMPDEQVTNYIKLLKSILLELDTVQAKRLEISLDEYKAKIRTDWWLYGVEAIENKAADATTDVTCSRDLTKQTYIETEQVFLFQVNVEKSRCPLIGRLRIVPPNEEKKDASGSDGRKIQTPQDGSNSR